MTPENSSSIFSIDQRVILLTGGAGLYGRGLAATLAQTGATLILASRDSAKLQVVAEEETAKGHRVFAESLDQGDEASVIALHDRIHAKFGPVDILVANAGGHGVGPTVSMSDETWALATRLNLDTAFVCARECLPDLMEQKGNNVVIDFGDGDVLTFLKFDKGDFNKADFTIYDF